MEKIYKTTVSMIFVFVIYGCASFSPKQQFPMQPEDILKNVEKYIRSGRLIKELSKLDCRKEFYKKHASENLAFDDLALLKLKYSLSHNNVTVQYCLKKSIYNNNSSGYDSIYVEVDKQGNCSISCTSETSSVIGDFKNQVESFPEMNLNDVLKKTNNFINNSEVNAVSNIKIDWNDSDEKRPYFKRIITNRIPEKIKLNDLILLDIEFDYRYKDVEVIYCLKPTIYCETVFDYNFLTVAVRFDQEGRCSFGRLQETSREDKLFQFNRQRFKLKPKELDDIYEATFIYMFEHAANWDKKIKMRFISANFHEPTKKDFFKRFQGENIPVRSPFEKYDDYKTGFTDKRYMPEGEDALFYSINGVEVFDNTHVFVKCSVTWHLLAARGYIYILEKKNGKWKVINVKWKWLS